MGTVVMIDSRVCVKRTKTGFSIDRQDISVVDAAEVVQRIAMFVRCLDMGLAVPGLSGIEGVVNLEEPSGNEKVCIAFNAGTKQIQFSAMGLTMWEVCVLLDLAHAYLNALQLGLIME